MKRSEYLSLFSFLLLIFLFFYTLETYPCVFRRDLSVEKLNKNRDYYEGKEILLPIIPIAEIGEQMLVLEDWNGRNRVDVWVADSYIRDLTEKSIVTIGGISYLNSRGYLKAELVHIHKNYFWRMYVSPIALLFILFLMYKEGVL